MPPCMVNLPCHSRETDCIWHLTAPHFRATDAASLQGTFSQRAVLLVQDSLLIPATVPLALETNLGFVFFELSRASAIQMLHLLS